MRKQTRKVWPEGPLFPAEGPVQNLETGDLEYVPVGWRIRRIFPEGLGLEKQLVLVGLIALVFGIGGGWLGGNFQWSWISGDTTAQSPAQLLAQRPALPRPGRFEEPSVFEDTIFEGRHRTDTPYHMQDLAMELKLRERQKRYQKYLRGVPRMPSEKITPWKPLEYERLQELHKASDSELPMSVWMDDAFDEPSRANSEEPSQSLWQGIKELVGAGAP